VEEEVEEEEEEEEEEARGLQRSHANRWSACLTGLVGLKRS